MAGNALPSFDKVHKNDYFNLPNSAQYACVMCDSVLVTLCAQYYIDIECCVQPTVAEILAARLNMLQ